MTQRDDSPEKGKAPKRSESPVGLTMPMAAMRLEHPNPEDCEKIMMRIWAEINTRDPTKHYGLIPLDTILHECNDQCGRPNLMFGDPHSYTGVLPEHDVRVVAATVQWLATPIGRNVLEKFFREIGYEIHFKPKPLNR